MNVLLLSIRHCYKMASSIRGVRRDRQGRWYWLVIQKRQTSGHFLIRLVALRGIRFKNYRRAIAGWLSVGEMHTSSAWMIFDVQAYHQQCGIGTLLVQAAIQLAQRSHCPCLRGWITRTDAASHPFLPAWYATFGFTIEPSLANEDKPATFWMKLPQA